jgi:prephenate dehydratase
VSAAGSPQTIAHLGPPGTYGEEALRAALGDALSEVTLLPVETNRDVVMAVERGSADAGFVPIENSVEGAVTETLDALVHDAPAAQIVGELVWPVHHCLIACAPADPASITTIGSHPQALAQCAEYIRDTLPNAHRLAQVSTAEAVREAIAQGDGHAAIGSRVAADTYGGTLLAENIEDSSGNKTRFVWLASEPLATGWAGTTTDGTPKTSIVFSGFNDTSPGGLVSILSEFAYRSVNMSKIESRPERTELGHYLFFVDLDGSIAEEAVEHAIEAIRGKVKQLRVLGSFASHDA